MRKLVTAILCVCMLSCNTESNLHELLDTCTDIGYNYNLCGISNYEALCKGAGVWNGKLENNTFIAYLDPSLADVQTMLDEAFAMAGYPYTEFKGASLEAPYTGVFYVGVCDNADVLSANAAGIVVAAGQPLSAEYLRNAIVLSMEMYNNSPQLPSLRTVPAPIIHITVNSFCEFVPDSLLTLMK